eukprot:1144337-Pelagomonas_calceolata.AAC.3
MGDSVGSGSFGNVYLGLNNDTGELLAIKSVSLMDDSGNSQRQEALEQLEHEVQVRVYVCCMHARAHARVCVLLRSTVRFKSLWEGCTPAIVTFSSCMPQRSTSHLKYFHSTSYPVPWQHVKAQPGSEGLADFCLLLCSSMCVRTLPGRTAW